MFYDFGISSSTLRTEKFEGIAKQCRGQYSNQKKTTW